MSNSTIPLPAKWEKFLKQLTADQQVELNSIINELCEWAFSNSESKRQFEAWQDSAYPPKGEAEDGVIRENIGKFQSLFSTEYATAPNAPQ
jgi:hypothetical protein